MLRSRLILPLLLACATLPAHAQQGGPAAGYDSAFAGYRAYQEPKVADWKQTNATVAALPGHDAHAGHAMGPMAPEAAADPHAGHDMSTMQHPAKPAAKALANEPAPRAAKVKAARPAKAAKPDPHADHQHH